jgi:hypothetical protein
MRAFLKARFFPFSFHFDTGMAEMTLSLTLMEMGSALDIGQYVLCQGLTPEAFLGVTFNGVGRDGDFKAFCPGFL